MSFQGWGSALVLGGIRSGKSAYAESLLGSAPSVRYVATATAPVADPGWAERIAAHQRRRPQSWTTEEIGADPSGLARLIAEAKPDEALLVDDLGGWVTALLDRGEDELAAAVVQLSSAVRESAARLVIVSPEVGLSVVPATVLGRAFADELGAANRAVAEACDAVVLVVAGQAAWLKPTQSGSREETALTASGPASSGLRSEGAQRPSDEGRRRVQAPTARASEASAEPTARGPARAQASARPTASARVTALTESTLTLPMVTSGLVIQPGMHLPMPSEDAAERARARLSRLDLPGPDLGELTGLVTFAAGTQDHDVPMPWRSVRVLLVTGHHAGGVGAGDSEREADRRVRQAAEGDGPLAMYAAEAGASLQVVEAPAARPIETQDALTAEEVDRALAYGFRLAEEAVDSGVDLLVIAASGAGAEGAAAAITATTTGAEVVSLLGRVAQPGGTIDDNAWMVRCAAIRDALHRMRARPRGAHDVLAGLGGGDIAIVTGALLGATARRTPVLLDGPVGIAAGLVSRDLGGQARHWCALIDDGRHPTVRYGADVLGLKPVLDLRLGLGEGATALAALPLLRTALTIAATTPEHPALTDPMSTVDPAAPESTVDQVPVSGVGPAVATTVDGAPQAEPEPGTAHADQAASSSARAHRAEQDMTVSSSGTPEDTPETTTGA